MKYGPLQRRFAGGFSKTPWARLVPSSPRRNVILDSDRGWKSMLARYLDGRLRGHDEKVRRECSDERRNPKLLRPCRLSGSASLTRGILWGSPHGWVHDVC